MEEKPLGEGGGRGDMYFAEFQMTIKSKGILGLATRVLSVGVGEEGFSQNVWEKVSKMVFLSCKVNVPFKKERVISNKWRFFTQKMSNQDENLAERPQIKNSR